MAQKNNKMDLFSKLFKKNTDSQLVLCLENHKFSALLFKASRLLGQVQIAENSPEAAAAALQKLLQKHACSRPEITLVLSEQCYHKTLIDKPAVPDEELPAALPWAVKDLISIPPENMLLDYFDMPATGSAKRITVVAADKQWVHGWVKCCSEQLKGEVKEIQIEELALLNLLNEEEAPTLMLWQKAQGEMEILLVHQQALYLSRSLRGTTGLAQMSGELLASVVDNISLEVQRALDYFESNLRKPPVRQVCLVFEHPAAESVQQLMAANLTPKVSYLTHPCQQQHALSPAQLPLLGAIMPPKQEAAK